MKIKNLLLILALVVSVNVAFAQPKPQSQPQKQQPAHPAVYKGSDVTSFKSWVARELRDDFAKFKRERVKVMGSIKVFIELDPKGSVKVIRIEDTQARDKKLDKRVSDAINRVVSKQKWTVKPGTPPRGYNFTLTY